MATIKDLEKENKELKEQLEAEKAKTAEQINAEALAGKEAEVKALTCQVGDLQQTVSDQNTEIETLKKSLEKSQKTGGNTTAPASPMEEGTPFVVIVDRFYHQGKIHKKDENVYLADKKTADSFLKSGFIKKR